LQKVLHLFDRIVRESGLPKRPPVGAMIETPSAVLEIERIVTMVDFISIGTNDLTQFMLAADRNSLLTLPGYSALQPAVLKAVAQVISAARQAACPACICGEAAGEPDIACLFTGMGIRELSMSPVRSVRVRQAIRQHSISDLDAMAEEVLSCATEQQVKNIISERRKKHDQR
jgi:phosphoenolpyruvate-protein kinase (PTS system EI component)